MRIIIISSTNANTKILNFCFYLFYAGFLAKIFQKKMKFEIFKHYEKTDTIFKFLVLEFVEGVILKNELSSFKTLGGNRFEDFLNFFPTNKVTWGLGRCTQLNSLPLFIWRLQKATFLGKLTCVRIFYAIRNLLYLVDK